MPRILLSPVKGQVLEPLDPANRLAIAAAREALKVKAPGAKYARNHYSKFNVKCRACGDRQWYKPSGCRACGESLGDYPPGSWDGYKHFMTPTGQFPAGFYAMLPAIWGEDYGPITAAYNPDPPHVKAKPVLKLNGAELRDYQVAGLLEALRHKRGILKQATNAGKTELALAFMKTLQALGPALWLTHSLDLSAQTRKRIEDRTGMTVSFCTRGQLDLSGQVVVSSVQTLHSKLKKGSCAPLKAWLQKVPVVVLDECHFGSADTWLEVLQLCTSAWYRIGLSGTPFTDDPVRNRKLVGATGPVLARVDNAALIDAEVSAVPTVVTLPFKHGEYLSYVDAMDNGVVENLERNTLIARTVAKLERGNPGLILVSRIEHGNRLCQALQNQGLKTLFVNGKTKLADRGLSIASMREHSMDCLVATNIFDLGIDVPELEYIVMASPTRSSVRVLQRVGRVLRRSESKTTARVYVVEDSGDSFIGPTATRMVKILSREGFVVI